MRPLRSVAHSAARTMLRAIRDRRAATAVEYGLMIAMIVLVMLAGLGPLATLVQGLWGNVTSTVAAPR